MAAVLFAVLASACAEQVIPKELEPQVDRNASFLQVKDTPTSYFHRTVVLGGEVLSVKAASDYSWIEVLQLPLDNSLEPATERTKSLGRFFAVQSGMVDPATLPAGTRVTVIGDVLVPTNSRIGEQPYAYPTLQVKHIKVWEPRTQTAGPGVGFGIGVIGGGGGGGVGGVGIGGGY